MLKCLVCQLQFQDVYKFSSHCIQYHHDYLHESEQLISHLITATDFQKSIDDTFSQNCGCASKLKFGTMMGFNHSLDDLKSSFCRKLSIEMENVQFQLVKYTSNILKEHAFCNQSGEPEHIISSNKKYIVIIEFTDHRSTCCYKYNIIGCLINSFIGLEEAKLLDNFIKDVPFQKVEKMSVRECADNVIKIKKQQYLSMERKIQVFSTGKQCYKSLCKNRSGALDPCFFKNGAKSIPLGCNVGDARCIFRLRTKKNDFQDSRRKHFRGLTKFEYSQEQKWYQYISKYSTQISKLYMEAFPVAYVSQCISSAKSCSINYNNFDGKSCFSGISVNIYAIKHW